MFFLVVMKAMTFQLPLAFLFDRSTWLKIINTLYSISSVLTLIKMLRKDRKTTLLHWCCIFVRQVFWPLVIVLNIVLYKRTWIFYYNYSLGILSNCWVCDSLSVHYYILLYCVYYYILYHVHYLLQIQYKSLILSWAYCILLWLQVEYIHLFYRSDRTQA